MGKRPFLTVTIIVVLGALMYMDSIVNPLLMAFFISIILVQPIKYLKAHKVPNGLAVLIVILGMLVTYVAFIGLIGSSVSMFIAGAPKYADNLSKITESTTAFLNEKGIDLSLISAGALDLSKMMTFTASMVGVFGDLMSNEFTFLLLTILLLSELDSVSLKMQSLSKDSTISFDYLRTIGDNIRHYLSIKTATSLLTGVLVTAGLAIIGVDYAILWGLIAFLLNYIPNIGSILAAVPAVAFALIQLGYDGALWTGLVFLVINMIVGNVIEPKVMGKGLGLSTFVVFVSLLFWGFILGPVGMFLSVPITMAIKIVLEQNPKTEYLATMLGTKDDALRVLNR